MSLKTSPEGPAFDDFVAVRGPALLRFCAALTGTPTDGEDLLQESLARCFLRWPKISNLEFVEAYVRRVIVSQHVSARRRRGLLLTSLSGEEPTASPSVDLDLREALRAALQRLPSRQRIVMVLTYLEDLPDVKIAAVMNCSINTVKSHRAKGLKHLRSAIPLAALRE